MSPAVAGEPGALEMLMATEVIAELDRIFAELEGRVTDPDGAVGERLFPRAYLDPTEDAAETFWRLSRRDGLVADRLAAIAAVRGDLAAATRARRGAYAVPLGDGARWMTVCNDARLWIGTELGLSDEDLEVGRGDPREPGYQRYVLLTAVLGEIVDVVLGLMPEAGEDDGPD
ncbi:MAG: DUF2017 family protein [Actinomycetota bacterium]